MTDTQQQSDDDSTIEATVRGSTVKASGAAVDKLLQHVGPALKWPILASAAGIVILAIGLFLKWTVFQ
jgi:hypothetical protein